MSFDARAISDAIAAHGRVARVVIAAIKGSSPREVGASMLVWDGGQSGTIGGGALEYEVAKSALSRPGLHTHALGPELGQCCGGAVTLATEVFEKAPPLSTHRLTDFLSRPKPMAIKRLENAVRQGEQIKPTLADGWLIEPCTRPSTELWVWGAGHVGRAIVRTLAPLPDFAMTWIDTAADRFPQKVPANVTTLPAAEPALLIPHAPRDAAHLVLTYSHAMDLAICDGLLRHDFSFAGLIGSKTKWARFQSRLERLGHPAAQISRITCPIGDPRLGKHPQAIAVGVAAGLLSLGDMATASCDGRREETG